jgi:hypothetical protein
MTMKMLNISIPNIRSLAQDDPDDAGVGHVVQKICEFRSISYHFVESIEVLV